MVRRIVEIDQKKCNGCGLCASACHEGAIGMVDGKATLLKDDYCDGLGDCLPACPTGAISFVEREAAALDPVKLLGFRFAFADGPLAARIANGARLRADELELFVRRRTSAALELCACTAGVRESCEAPEDGEIVSVIVENKLAALYAFDASKNVWSVACVFQKGVSRGSCV